MEGMTRADLLARGTRMGLALAATGSAAALAASAAAGQEAPGEEDLATVRMAASAELLGIDFYTRALATDHFSREEAGYLREARRAEQEHYRVLAATLVEATQLPPLAEDFEFTYPARGFTTRQATIALGTKLETVFVSTYLGGVASLVDAGLRNAAAQIAAVENRHAGAFAAMAGLSPAGPAFPEGYDVERASAALASYLGA
jgi:rubrerythrin